MESLILICVIFSLGWWLGSAITGHMQREAFKQILLDLNIDPKDIIRAARKGAPPEMLEQLDMIESQVDAAGLEHIEIKVEQHSNTLYAFRKDNDQFIGQGSSKDELIAAMAHRLKNVRLTVVEGNELLQKNNTEIG